MKLFSNTPKLIYVYTYACVCVYICMYIFHLATTWLHDRILRRNFPNWVVSCSFCLFCPVFVLSFTLYLLYNILYYYYISTLIFYFLHIILYSLYYLHVYFLVRNRKGMNPDKKGGEEKLEGIEEGKNTIIIYDMKNSIFYKNNVIILLISKKKGKRQLTLSSFSPNAEPNYSWNNAIPADPYSRASLVSMKFCWRLKVMLLFLLNLREILHIYGD